MILQVNHINLINDNTGDYLLRDISFSLKKGEVLGLLGSSGSGKSLLCRTILQLLAKNLSFTGEIDFYHGKKIIDLTLQKNQKSVRGKYISLMFQDVFASLNPLLTVHTHLKQIMHRELINKILFDVGFKEPAQIYKKHPHQLSGGELSRLGLALALAGNPRILILDEVFASIDRSLQKKFMAILKDQVKNSHKAVILVTHNMAVLENFVDTILVLKKGQVTDYLSTKELFRQPVSEYLGSLIQAYEKLYKSGPV